MKSRYFPFKTAFLVVLALIIALPIPVCPQLPGLDPQSLVGEWSGTWEAPGGKGKGKRGVTTGQYHLVIDTIDGNKVAGRILRQTNFEADTHFEGMLDSSRLVFTTKRTRTELNIDGHTMRGTLSGGASIVPHEIRLMKTK